MSSIKVFNELTLERRDMKVHHGPTGNDYTVSPGGSTAPLSFLIGNTLTITILGDSADQLDNGCWFLIPKWCGYEFQPQAPDGLVLVDEPDDMIELNADPHIPQWELTITRTSEKADLLGEPNVTVGDNQGVIATIFKEDIKKKVIRAIAFMSGYDIEDITLEKKLKINLGLTGYQRKALASAFIRIAKSYNPNAKITRSQCEKLKTVKDAVDLVTKAASIKDREEA